MFIEIGKFRLNLTRVLYTWDTLERASREEEQPSVPVLHVCFPGGPDDEGTHDIKLYGEDRAALLGWFEKNQV